MFKSSIFSFFTCSKIFIFSLYILSNSSWLFLFISTFSCIFWRSSSFCCWHSFWAKSKLFFNWILLFSKSWTHCSFKASISCSCWAFKLLISLSLLSEVVSFWILIAFISFSNWSCSCFNEGINFSKLVNFSLSDVRVSSPSFFLRIISFWIRSLSFTISTIFFSVSPFIWIISLLCWAFSKLFSLTHSSYWDMILLWFSSNIFK